MASPEALQGVKTSVRTSHIYAEEKLHYYGFIVAPYLMTGGWAFIESYPERLSHVTWDQCRQAAGKWFGSPSYVATVVRPAADNSAVLYRPTGLTATEVTGYFDTATFAPHGLTVGQPVVFPSTDSVTLDLTENAVFRREILPNGLTVIIKSSSASSVFAMNVFGKNRTLDEPEGQEGITDFVNHLVEKGTVTRDAEQLSRDLAAIGANVTLYDNPWIPYDDRYTTRMYSFMKFETIEEYAEKGFYLFCEMLLWPAFDSSQVENVRRALMGELGREAAAPREVARDLYYQTLFEGQTYGRPIEGTPQSIAAITRDDLMAYHERFYAPDNLILSIVTSRPVEEVSGWVNRVFGRQTAVGVTSPPPVVMAPLMARRTQQRQMTSEQVAIYLGGPLPGASSSEEVPLRVAISILSERLGSNLREKQGLAYSVGAADSYDREIGWYCASISTGPDHYQAALDGILLEIDKLKYDGPANEEVVTARNSLWGQLQSARLSRINQAYYLALDEYLGRDMGYDQVFLKQLQAVNADAIRRVMAKYFSTDVYILAAAGALR